MAKLTRAWWRAALIRAAKTVVQSALAALTSAAALGEIDWALVIMTAVLAGANSLFTSLPGLPEVPKNDEAEG